MKGATIILILEATIAHEARVLSDEAPHYGVVGGLFTGGNGYTYHSKVEYVFKVDRSLHTSTIEGFFSVFTGGMKGIYQHRGHNHLNRYLAEFDFRYNTRMALSVNDVERAETLLLGVTGKRLTY
jgi:hypothetical protein